MALNRKFSYRTSYKMKIRCIRNKHQLAMSNIQSKINCNFSNFENMNSFLMRSPVKQQFLETKLVNFMNRFV